MGQSRFDAGHGLGPVGRWKSYAPEFRAGQNELDPHFDVVALPLPEVSYNTLCFVPCRDIQNLQPLSLGYGS